MPPSENFSFTIESAAVGMRLDAVIARQVRDCSRSVAARLVKTGRVTANGVTVKPGYRVRIDDRIEGRIPPLEPAEYTPEPIPLDVLFEDSHLIVINKPSGLVVHPAPGHHSGTLVNGLLHHCRDLSGIGGQLRPGIVHRLDKDTSGVLVVAKTDTAHGALARQFKERRVQKRYLALVYGIPGEHQGVIDFPIGRHPVERKKMSIHAPRGRSARTRWCIQRNFKESALLRIALETGRTHQIRVHMAAMHSPVVGDPVYGSRRRHKSFPWPPGVKPPLHQMLHAFSLGFQHPETGVYMSFKAQPPVAMRGLIRALAAQAGG